MWKLLATLQKNLVWAIPISMTLGLLGGYLFDTTALKQVIIPVTFLMVYPMMVTLNVKTIFKGHDLKLQLLTQVINFALIPLVAFGLGKTILQAWGCDRDGIRCCDARPVHRPGHCHDGLRQAGPDHCPAHCPGIRDPDSIRRLVCEAGGENIWKTVRRSPGAAAAKIGSDRTGRRCFR